MDPDMRESDREFCARALACLKRALPGDEPDEADIVPSREHSPVLTNLNNGLLAAYLVDEVSHFQYVQQRHLDSAGLTQAELHQQCIATLRTLLKQKDIKVQPYGNVFAILCGGNFEASAVLVDGLWNNALAHLAPNGFVVAIPCRDILAFCDAGNASGLQELRQLIERTQDGDHPISSVLYRRSAGTWERMPIKAAHGLVDRSIGGMIGAIKRPAIDTPASSSKATDR
jgi:Protein of unknown function (DUF1444)